MTLMRREDYSPQEPFSELASSYDAEVMRLAEGVDGEDVAYGEDPYQHIALFVPRAPNGTVLACVHGGGWTNGYKEWMAFMAPAFTSEGVLFASLGYRLAPQHVFPANFDDLAGAVAWLHANVARYGGDRRRLFITGHSAGGQLSALLAVRRDWQHNRGLPADVLRGCLPCSGIYDFTESSGLSMRPRFLGPEGNERRASPLFNIQGTPSPIMMSHGSDDFPHLIAQAERMEAALRDSGCDVERIVLEGTTHFTSSFVSGDTNGPWVPPALAWMAAH